MILLDTHVMSEPLRPTPDARVVAWMDAQVLESLYLSAMTVAELRAGVALLRQDKRRYKLHEGLETRVQPRFAGRMLPFDIACTSTFAQVLAIARQAGRAIETADACIAAVALANGMTFATRDTSPSLAAGVAVINPWTLQVNRLIT